MSDFSIAERMSWAGRRDDNLCKEDVRHTHYSAFSTSICHLSMAKGEQNAMKTASKRRSTRLQRVSSFSSIQSLVIKFQGESGYQEGAD